MTRSGYPLARRTVIKGIGAGMAAAGMTGAMPSQAATMADGSPDMDGADHDLEALSAFDVPAFLRREG